MMDNKPLSAFFPGAGAATGGGRCEAGLHLSCHLHPGCRLPYLYLYLTGERRKSPLRDILVGPDGIYAVPRWLIYLAIAFVVFQIEGWLLASLQSRI